MISVCFKKQKFYFKEKNVMVHSKTISIDFDGVIHKYREGWKDGSIYDDIDETFYFNLIKLLQAGLSNKPPYMNKVFILSARNSATIVEHLNKDKEYFKSTKEYKEFSPDFKNIFDNKLEFKEIKEGVSFFSPEKMGNPYIIGVTNKKLPAHYYVDDRAVKFTSFKDLYNIVKN